jgi:bromodomain-containing factor 1
MSISQSLNAPGTGNPYNKTEEEDMQATRSIEPVAQLPPAPISPLAPVEVQMTESEKPSFEAVSDSRENILSPVKVDGDSASLAGPPEPVMQSTVEKSPVPSPPSAPPHIVSAVDEPVETSQTRVENEAAPLVEMNIPEAKMEAEPVHVPEVEPVPIAKQEPLPIEKEEVAPLAKEEPAPFTKEEPVPAASEEPTPIAKEEPASAVKTDPASLIREELIEMPKEEPAVVAKDEDTTMQTATGSVVPSQGTTAATSSLPEDEPPAKRQRKSESQGSTDAAKPMLAGPESTTMTPAQIKFCQNAIKALKGRPEAGPFLVPVDYVALNIPHYPDKIKEPMDLGTIDMRLALTAAAAKGGNKPTEKTKQALKWNLDPVRDVFPSVAAFERDTRLVFSNCVTFNGPDHILSKNAETLEGVFDKQLKVLPSAAPSTPFASLEDNGSYDAPITPNGSSARRISDAASRPKRDIHPPAPKDLPWMDRPHSAPGTAKKKKAKRPLTAREEAHYAKVTKDQFKFVSKFVDDLHKPPMSAFAWVFFNKPTMDLDFAQSYYAMIKKPISLKEIKERLTHSYYESIEDAKYDMDLMLNNCFTFNEHGSDVWQMGMEVKKLWETRLAKMPQPAPLEDEYEEDDDEGDDEADVQAQAIRDQIANLQAQLEGLQGNNKAAGAKMLASAKASLAAMPGKKAAKKRRPSESNGSSKKSAGPKKPKAPAAGPSVSAGSTSSEAKKARARKPSEGKKKDDDVREVSYEQKEELAAKITQLPDDRLDGALKIIAEDKPQSANEDEEIELDIDDLSPATLYKLYRYVVRPKGKKMPSKVSSSDGRKRGTGGVKRKNLDEGEEAARIARLQEQLQQFDNPEAGGGAQRVVSSGAHDDLVQSESSSGEEDSESESDFE